MKAFILLFITMILLINSVYAAINLGLAKDSNCNESKCQNTACNYKNKRENTEERENFCGNCTSCNGCEADHLYTCNANGFTGCDYGPRAPCKKNKNK